MIADYAANAVDMALLNLESRPAPAGAAHVELFLAAVSGRGVSLTQPGNAPRIWVLVSDKAGDNAQVDAVVDPSGAAYPVSKLFISVNQRVTGRNYELARDHAVEIHTAEHTARSQLHVRGDRIAMIFQDPMMTLNPVLRVDTQMIEAIHAHADVSRAAPHDVRRLDSSRPVYRPRLATEHPRLTQAHGADHAPVTAGHHPRRVQEPAR